MEMILQDDKKKIGSFEFAPGIVATQVLFWFWLSLSDDGQLKLSESVKHLWLSGCNLVYFLIRSLPTKKPG